MKCWSHRIPLVPSLCNYTILYCSHLDCGSWYPHFQQLNPQFYVSVSWSESCFSRPNPKSWSTHQLPYLSPFLPNFPKVHPFSSCFPSVFLMFCHFPTTSSPFFGSLPPSWDRAPPPSGPQRRRHGAWDNRPWHANHGAGIFTYKTGWFCSGKCWDSYSIISIEHLGWGIETSSTNIWDFWAASSLMGIHWEKTENLTNTNSESAQDLICRNDAISHRTDWTWLNQQWEITKPTHTCRCNVFASLNIDRVLSIPFKVRTTPQTKSMADRFLERTCRVLPHHQ